MLHFRIHSQHQDIKALLFEYDSDWSTIASKIAQLFEIPTKNVALIHQTPRGKDIVIRSQDELRDFVLGPNSARAVAGLPLDFDLRDTREWKYSIISHIGASEAEDADFEIPDRMTVMSPEQMTITAHRTGTIDSGTVTGGHVRRFTDEDYTFVQPPALDASDMVHVVVPGEGPYAVPRNMGVGSNVNLHIVEDRGDPDWDELKPPSDGDGDGNGSVEYPNVHLEEPPKPQSIASSGPPRIPSREKGKGRAIHSQPMNNPFRPPSHIEIVSDKSIIDNDVGGVKPTIHIPDRNHSNEPIPLISNIVKKMSLENAKARTIYDGEDTPAPGKRAEDTGYNTLVNQLVSLVDVVTTLLEDKTVANQVRDTWEGFTQAKGADGMNEPPSPTSTLGFGRRERKSKEFALAEGLVSVMKKVANIVEDDMSDVEEREGDVIWTRRTRGHGLGDIRLPKVYPETPAVEKRHEIPPPLKSPATGMKTSRQRLEEAKAAYKAEKTRYRMEREQRRRDKLAAKGLMYPEPIVEDKKDEPVPIVSAPPGRKASLMSAGAPDQQGRSHSRLVDSFAAAMAGAVPNKAASSTKPSAGSTYSPALLPVRMPSNNVGSIAPPNTSRQATLSHTRPLKEETAHDGGDEGSDGPGTPKPPPRPSRGSAQFDFDAFMESSAWGPKANANWVGDQSPYPVSARHTMMTQKHGSMLPPPPPMRVYMQNEVVLDDPDVVGVDVKSDNTAPTPPPRPQRMSSGPPPPMQVHNGMENVMADAFRTNPLPRTLSKRNRWGDGIGGRRMDVGREDSLTFDAHPPPVYSTDGEGGDELLESGGAPREKGALPLNEEFKRRCLAVLHEYNVTQNMYPNLDVLIAQGIQVVGGNRQMVRLAAESNSQAREKFLSEEVPNVVNRVLGAVQRGSTPNYV